MGAEAAVALTQRRQLAAASDAERPALRQQMIELFNATVATPWTAAERGYIDAVIEPAHTRLEIRKALRLLCDKAIQHGPRKHHIMPL